MNRTTGKAKTLAGRKGGREAAKRMTPEQRKAKALMMVQARERKRNFR